MQNPYGPAAWVEGKESTLIERSLSNKQAVEAVQRLSFGLLCTSAIINTSQSGFISNCSLYQHLCYYKVTGAVGLMSLLIFIFSGLVCDGPDRRHFPSNSWPLFD